MRQLFKSDKLLGIGICYSWWYYNTIDYFRTNKELNKDLPLPKLRTPMELKSFEKIDILRCRNDR